MKKTIWILNHYASQDYLDHGGRHYWISKYLKREGYNPVIFCCNKIHNTDRFCVENTKLYSVRINEDIHVPFVFVRGRDYQGNDRKRIFNMIDFYINIKRVAKIYEKKHGKPNIIYASSAHPLTLIAGIQLAKKYRVRCICEVRDLWPESFVVYGLIKKSLLLKLLYCVEHQIYKKADSLIFTMEGGRNYVIDKGWDKDVCLSKISYINNGIDLEIFDSNKKLFEVEDNNLNDSDIFKAVYVGSIRKINDIDSLLDVAKNIKNERIKILIWGNGDKFNDIRKRIENEKIKNVALKSSIEKKYIPYVLSCGNVFLMHGKTSEIAKYGMSPNKLFEYFAAGKPIISTLQGRYNLVTQNGAGVSADVLKTKEYAKAIEDICNLTLEDYSAMCKRSREIGEEFDFKKLTKKLIRIIEAI